MAHDCAEEICEMSDDIEKEEEETVEEQPDPATEAMEDEDKDDDQGVQEDDPVEVAENVQDFEESSRGGQQNQLPEEPDPQRPSTSSRTFRVNSPSYQAVQHEFELFEREGTYLNAVKHILEFIR